MRKALELTIYHDCTADNDFEVGVVDTDEGVIQGRQVSHVISADVVQIDLICELVM